MKDSADLDEGGRRRVFAGDVGGTTTRLGLYHYQGDQLISTKSHTVPTEDLISSIRELFGREIAGLSACFALAGPVSGRRVKLTNRALIVDADELAAEFDLASVCLINDLEATAWAVTMAEGRSLVRIKDGVADPTGNRAVISAGTGLGQAGLVHDGRCYVPFATEGGHVDFAPSNAEELELYAFLASSSDWDHVSWERVVSGEGLVNLAQFFFSRSGESFETWINNEAPGEDPSAAVSAAALRGDPQPCIDAVRLFVRCYGAQAGNLALSLGATGGVFLGGGIGPKIRQMLGNFGFEDRFLDKGRMRTYLQTIPVDLIVDEGAPLSGAALRAFRTPR